MALIGSIRKRTGLLIGIIAVAMLAFLLMDGLSTQSRMGGAGSQNVGKIAGQKISAQDFGRMYENYESRYTTFDPNFETDEAGRAQIREFLWNDIVTDKLLGKNYKNLGLSVKADELKDALYGENIHEIARNVFSNPQTREFDKNYAYQAIKAVEDGTDVVENDVRIIGHLKQIVRESLLKEKYADLYNAGDYVPDFLARQSKKNGTANASVSYIYFPYSEVLDTDIAVSDNELQKYLDAHSSSYEKEATRSVWTYKIDIIPSSQDSSENRNGLIELIQEWKDSKVSDSLFVKKYSDGADLDVVYQVRDKLLANPNVEEFFEDEVGTYYNPYFDGGSYVISKLVDRKLIADSIKASHILLANPTTFEEQDSLIALADSLIELINNGASFSALAAIHSTDGSKDSGGDLGYFKAGQMVKPFEDAAFHTHKEGDVYKVGSQFGLHIVKIIDSNPSTVAVRIAEVSHELEYSKYTAKDLLNEMNEFRLEHDSPAKFEAAAENSDYIISKLDITQNQVVVGQLGQAREIVKWAFTGKVGEIKDFDINDKYILAYIKDESKKGTQSLSAVKGEITQKVLNTKKAEKIISGMPAFSDLQDLASKSGKEVQSNVVLRASSPRLKGGEEAAVAGKVFGMEQGSVSKPLEGINGCYVVKLESISTPEVDENTLASEKNNLKVPFEIGAAVQELKEKSNIQDARYTFY